MEGHSARPCMMACQTTYPAVTASALVLVDDGGPRQPERALGGGDGVPQLAARVACVTSVGIYVVQGESSGVANTQRMSA